MMAANNSLLKYHLGILSVAKPGVTVVLYGSYSDTNLVAAGSDSAVSY